MKRLSENLRLIRKKQWGMSQDKFAELMGSSRSKINSYENGGVEPSIAFMVRLQLFTGVSIKDLFGSELLIENLPAKPLSPESEPLVIIEEDQASYDKALLSLNNYHKEMANRVKSLEQRIKQLEAKDKINS